MNSDSKPGVMNVDSPSPEIESSGSDTEPTSLQANLQSRNLEPWDGFEPKTPEELLEVLQASFNSSSLRLPEHLTTETLKQGYGLAYKLREFDRKLRDVRSGILLASGRYSHREEASHQSVQELRNALNGLQVAVDRVCNVCTGINNENGAKSGHPTLFNTVNTAASFSDRFRNEIVQLVSQPMSVNFRHEAVVHAAAALSLKHGELWSSMTKQTVARMEWTNLELEENEIENNLAAAKEDCRQWFQEVGGLS